MLLYTNVTLWCRVALDFGPGSFFIFLAKAKALGGGGGGGDERFCIQYQCSQTLYYHHTSAASTGFVCFNPQMIRKVFLIYTGKDFSIPEVSTILC